MSKLIFLIVFFIAAGIFTAVKAAAKGATEARNHVYGNEKKHTQKNEALNHQPKQAASSAEDEERQFSTAFELVQMQMMGATMLYEEQLSKMTNEQEKLYLAFELGIIEYFHRTFLAEDETKSSDVKLFNFLIYYANKQYSNNSEQVF